MWVYWGEREKGREEIELIFFFLVLFNVVVYMILMSYM